MKLLDKFKLAYQILTKPHFFVFIADSKGYYNQAAQQLTIPQADTIIDNLVYATNQTEAETYIMHQVNNILNGISPN